MSLQYLNFFLKKTVKEQESDNKILESQFN